MIEFQNINKNFDHRGINALYQINFNISKSEIIAIIGPSGSGKSTLLNLLAKKDHPTSGEIKSSISDQEMVFPTMQIVTSPEQGIRSFYIEHATGTNDERIEKMRYVLELFSLEYLERKKFSQISEGQKQRVILSLAFLNKPKLILLDEPFSHLDPILRFELSLDLKNIIKKEGTTCIFSTHDINEVFQIPDRVISIEMGKILQIGTAQDLYLRPIHTSVASIMGDTNLFHGKIRFENGHALLKTNHYSFEIDQTLVNENEFYYLQYRPEEIKIVEKSNLFARVKEIQFMGHYQKLKVEIAGVMELILFVSRLEDFKIEQKLFLEFSKTPHLFK